MNAPHPPFDEATTIVGAPVPHDSAELHVAGEAHYTDDLPEPRGMLHAAIGVSAHAHGTIEHIDLAGVLAVPGVVAVLTPADIPGINDVGPIQRDDPILAERIVEFAGQPIFAVCATSVSVARRAVAEVRVDITPLPALLTIDAALAAQSYVLPPVHVTRGDPAGALFEKRGILGHFGSPPGSGVASFASRRQMLRTRARDAPLPLPPRCAFVATNAQRARRRPAWRVRIAIFFLKSSDFLPRMRCA